jgi:phosphatidylinositol alpha-1,6-mannosyltransferase
MDSGMSMHVNYWTGWLDPELLAVSREVHQLMRRFPRSCAFGLSRNYSFKLSFRHRSFGVHLVAEETLRSNDKEVVRGLGGNCASFLPTLVLSEHFLPDCGGTITWLLQIYRRYEPAEVVVVAGEHRDAQLVDSTLPFKVERVSMSMSEWDPTLPASLWRYAGMLRHVLRSCRRYRIQQLHCMRVLPEGLIAWCVRLLTGRPYLLYAHGEEILISRGSRKLRWLIPRLFNRAAAIIANSRKTQTLLAEIGVRPEKIHIIHPGVEPAAFRIGHDAALAIRERHNLGQSPVLLTVGRLQRRKGQDMVIQTLPSIAKRFPDVKYVIVGTGEDRAFLQRLATDIGVQDKVIFVGEVADGEQAAYYAACDVFIMPNRQIGPDIEGFGMVFLEAGAAGKPVIGGCSGGTGDAIQEGVTGVRVDGESVEAIAAAVIDLLANPEKACAMGERGRRRVETAFNWESIVERTRHVALTMARGI